MNLRVVFDTKPNVRTLRQLAVHPLNDKSTTNTFVINTYTNTMQFQYLRRDSYTGGGRAGGGPPCGPP